MLGHCCFKGVTENISAAKEFIAAARDILQRGGWLTCGSLDRE